MSAYPPPPGQPGFTGGPAQGQPFGGQPPYGPPPGGQPPYGSPPGGQPPYPPGGPGPSPHTSRNWAGIAALVCGGLALLCAWWVIPAILGIAGVIFAILGLNAAKKGLASNRAMSIVGLVASILSFIVAAVVAIAAVAVINTPGSWLTSGPSIPASAYPTSTRPTSPATPAATTVNLGETSTMADMFGTDEANIVVTKVIDPATAAVPATSGSRYVAAAVTVKNSGANKIFLSFVTGVECQSTSGSSAPTYRSMTEGKSLAPLQALEPGATEEGLVVFQIPKGDQVTGIQLGRTLWRVK